MVLPLAWLMMREGAVENLARKLMLAQSGPCRRERYIIAEAELDLLRIRDDCNCDYMQLTYQFWQNEPKSSTPVPRKLVRASDARPVQLAVLSDSRDGFEELHAQIDEDRQGHGRLEPRQIQRAELLPLGDDDERVGTFRQA
jgi:hypothetical protein